MRFAYGIEDSHMAVREARRQGQAVHSVVIDEDGQDWFARIFGRGGFTLMPDPARLIRRAKRASIPASLQSPNSGWPSQR